MNVREALTAAERRLAEAGCETPALDARVLLGNLLGLDGAGLIAHDRDSLGDRAARFEDLLRRRERGEPVAYLTGGREFWSLPFEVTPAVLVPRPETETLVDAALAWLEARAPDRGAVVLDVGTGSGAIAIALAHESACRPRAGAPRRFVAVDRSADALSVASRNAARLLSRGEIRFWRGDLTEAVGRASVDLLVSNPPYLTPAEVDRGPRELSFEPRLALDGGSADGLDVVRALLADAARVLRPGGRLLCEIGSAQADLAAGRAREVGFEAVEVLRDLADRPRVLRADAAGTGGAP